MKAITTSQEREKLILDFLKKNKKALSVYKVSQETKINYITTKLILYRLAFDKKITRLTAGGFEAFQNRRPKTSRSVIC